ncbi:MAG: hypothetical protein ACKKL5_01165 [Candidatus Komeilibacteria bacterium]
MTNFAGASPDEQNKRLLEENLAISQEIRAEIQRIRRYILWGRIMTAVQFLLIIVPIILGIIYLPPLVQQFIGSFSSLGGANGSIPGQVTDPSTWQGLLEQYKGVLDLYK